jgi:hypothetical protein
VRARSALLFLLALAGCASTARPSVTLEIEPGELALSRERLQRWVDESQAIIRASFGALPVAELHVRVQPRGRARGVRDGSTGPQDGGALIEVAIGGAADEHALERDWVLVHEMIHLAVPELPPAQHWFEEGVATYLEPFARARGGKLGEQDVWRELTGEYAQGLPLPGEGGLEDTRTWARTYYGGALFCLVADIGIARATHGTKSLRDAFAGTVARGMSIRQGSDLEHFAAELDRALGVEVVGPLHAQWAHTPVQVDLAELWKELGVVRAGREIRFDDSAPLAAWRAKLATP